MKIVVLCPYCSNEAKLVTGKKVYPHRPDLFHRKFYLCEPCQAYVGTHKKTLAPLGRLADRSLRSAKMKAHKAFDPLWRKDPVTKKSLMTRSHAYKWLADQMEIKLIDCHIGMFDIAQCYQAITLIRLYQENNNASNA